MFPFCQARSNNCCKNFIYVLYRICHRKSAFAYLVTVDNSKIATELNICYVCKNIWAVVREENAKIALLFLLYLWMLHFAYAAKQNYRFCEEIKRYVLCHETDEINVWSPHLVCNLCVETL